MQQILLRGDFISCIKFEKITCKIIYSGLSNTYGSVLPGDIAYYMGLFISYRVL